MTPDAIDLRTVFLLTTLVAMTTAAAMMFLWRSHPGERSLPVWALGALLVAAGYMGIALRGWVPTFVSIPLANACIVSGHACFLAGIDRMTGRKPPAAPAILALALAIVASLSYFTYMESSTAIRMAIQFVVLGLLSVITARHLLAGSDRESRLPQRAVATVFMVFGLTLLIRVGLMPFDVPGQNLFAPSTIHQVVFVVLLLFYAALMYCFPAVLFAKEIMQRQRTETAIVAARNQLQATLAAIPDLLFEMDLDGRYYDVYATNTSLLAAPADALLSGQGVHDVLPAGAAETTLSALREANESGQSHGKQIELTLPRGRLWFELSVAKKAAEPEGASRFIVLSRDITKRKHAEIALRTSTGQLEEAQRIAQVGSWTLDLVSGELIWSAEVFRLFEIDRSRFGATYEAFLNAIHPDDRDAVNQAYTDSLVTRQPYEITHRLRMDDGRIKWVQECCTSDFDEIGNPLRSLGTVQDVTERKLAEIALRQSEQKFSTAFASCPVAASIAMAEDGRFIEVNANFQRDFGWIKSDLIGRTSVEVGIWPDQATRQPWAEAMRRAGRLVDYETVWMHKNGERRDVSLSGEITELDGKPCILAYATDITARKQAEAELRVAAAAFESQEAMLVTDARSVILRVNRAFTEITGYTAEESIGRTPGMLKSGRHNAEFYREMWEAINRTGVWQGEVWDRRKNGEVYPKWLTISAVKDGNGAVTHYIGAHYDITDRKLADEKISRLAFFDQLTGLPNRTLLLDRMKQTMAASARSGNHGALLFIDLDNFKTLNDTLGHDTGDQLLTQVAQRLALCVRDGDTVARLGGDEFVVVLAGLSTDEAEAASGVETVAEKIRFSLNRAYSLAGLAHRSSASIGITLFKGDRATLDELMKQADLAMYKSKDAGRNALSFFDPGMASVVHQRVAMEDELRRGLDEKQFLLHYQAQVAGGQVTGAEVLVRWRHPARGMVSPAEFILLAEETGLILPLGRWVLETACRQLASWAARPGMTRLTVAVNVSARQFRQADFVDQVLMVIKDTGANPQRLKLELTESMLVHDMDQMIEKMFALKAKGVSFSLDDFGTGYSSLSYLKRLPLDQLKIDQSFVRDVLVDPNDAAIARTVVALAQNLGLGVIAEGVETQSQHDFLASSGCHAYQGYLFSKPIPIDDFEQFVAMTKTAA